MLADPPSVAPHETVRAAAERMCALNASFLVVHDDGGDPIGLVTDRDITMLTAAGRDAATTAVRDAMTPQVVFCRASDDVEDAVWLMERHEVRRVLVLDDGRRVVGVLSVDDVARALSTQLAGSVLRHTSAPM
ncbi:MAG TPA: CBS domain-containing protein [Polyangia bacterium]